MTSVYETKTLVYVKLDKPLVAHPTAMTFIKADGPGCNDPPESFGGSRAEDLPGKRWRMSRQQAEPWVNRARRYVKSLGV